jgi:hypothetical protein
VPLLLEELHERISEGAMTEQTSRTGGNGPTRKRRPAGEATGTAKVAAQSSGKSGFGKKTIALVYDFDGTLSPRPMQEYTFLPKIGEDPKTFWREANAMAREQEADPLITYMHLMYKKAKARGVRIDRDDLVALGRDV